MRPTLLDDLIQLCQQSGAVADALCSVEAHDDPLTAVLRQSIALREQGFNELSLQLLDQAQFAGISSGWMNDNRARAMIRLGRIEPALQLWTELLIDGSDAALQACAQRALDRFQWPQDLVAALDEGNLQQAQLALDCWFDGLAEPTLGTRELLRVFDQGDTKLLRLIPLLKQRLERESFGDGQVLLHGLQQRTSPAVVEQLLRIGPNTLLVMGCLSAAGPAEAVVGEPVFPLSRPRRADHACVRSVPGGAAARVFAGSACGVSRQHGRRPVAPRTIPRPSHDDAPGGEIERRADRRTVGVFFQPAVPVTTVAADLPAKSADCLGRSSQALADQFMGWR